MPNNAEPAPSRRAPGDLVPPTPSAALRRSGAGSVAAMPGAGGAGGGGPLSTLASAASASAVGDDLLRGLSSGQSLRSMVRGRPSCARAVVRRRPGRSLREPCACASLMATSNAPRAPRTPRSPPPPAQSSSRALLRVQRVPVHLQLLWTWACPATEGMCVTSLSWNHANPDLLAAGYAGDEGGGGASGSGGGASAAGASNSGGGALSARRAAPREQPAGAAGAAGGGAAARPAGLVALWSTRNLSFPRLLIKTKSGAHELCSTRAHPPLAECVMHQRASPSSAPSPPPPLPPACSAVTALDFSACNPAMLAVGLRDGTVAIYDVRPGSGPQPAMQSTMGNGKHADPVWQARRARAACARGCHGPCRVNLAHRPRMMGNLVGSPAPADARAHTRARRRRPPCRCAGWTAAPSARRRW